MNRMYIEYKKSHKASVKAYRDIDGNDHLDIHVYKDSTEPQGEVILQTPHGKLTEHKGSYSAHFNFKKGTKDIPELIEEEASDMADFLVARFDTPHS